MYSNRQFGDSKFRRGFATEFLRGGFPICHSRFSPASRIRTCKYHVRCIPITAVEIVLLVKMINEVFEQRDTLLYHAELQRQFLTVCQTSK